MTSVGHEAAVASAGSGTDLPAPPPPEHRKASAAVKLRRVLVKHPALGPFAVLVLSVAAFGSINPRLLTFQSMSLMLAQVAVIGTLAIGQSLVIITAGIDISCGAAMILVQMVMAGLAIQAGVSPLLALMLGFLLGSLLGFLNGFFVSMMRMQPFVVTLGTLSVFTALALVYSRGTSLNPDPSSPLMWTGIPVQIGPLRLTTGVLLMLALYLAVGYLLRRTAWGAHVYATGDDMDAAHLVGIKSNRLLLGVYVIAGVLFAFAGWIQIGYSAVATTNISPTLNLASITAAAIGGISFLGGRGVVLGALFGALIVQVFKTGLILAGVDSMYTPLAEGALVIVAVALDRWIRQERTRM